MSQLVNTPKETINIARVGSIVSHTSARKRYNFKLEQKTGFYTEYTLFAEILVEFLYPSENYVICSFEAKSLAE